MATLSEEMVAARLQLDCSGAGASDVIVKVAEATVNGSKDYISDFFKNAIPTVVLICISINDVGGKPRRHKRP